MKKAGRVLIFFTHFPLETPFLKAAVRPRSLRLSPRSRARFHPAADDLHSPTRSPAEALVEFAAFFHGHGLK